MSTLIFHRVLQEPDELFPGEVDAKRFDDLCHWLKRWFNVLPADHAVRLLQAGRLPSRALCITFDDGYADNHDVALPILKRHGLHATFFVATGFLDGGRMWNDTVIESVRRTQAREIELGHMPILGFERLDLSTISARRKATGQLLSKVKYLEPAQRQTVVQQLAESVGVELPSDLMMTREQVRALRSAGMTIGAHTVNHPILQTVDERTASLEMEASKAELERLTGEAVDLFAYPNGKPGVDFSSRDVTLASNCGFLAAFTTAAGVSMRATDVFQLPRFTPWKQNRTGFGLQMARNMLFS